MSRKSESEKFAAKYTKETSETKHFKGLVTRYKLKPELIGEILQMLDTSYINGARLSGYFTRKHFKFKECCLRSGQKFLSAFNPRYGVVARGRNEENLAELKKLVLESHNSGFEGGWTLGVFYGNEEELDNV